MRSKAVLLPGLTVTLQNEQGGAAKTWRYPLGLQGYLEEMGAGVEAVSPGPHRREICHFRRRDLR
ncbi:MAG: hypothetical protein M5R42_19595 [Rhodocyclaceae bacterium]|nr:hypothetical protein [Rhodocyclaceae bacterium]